MSNLLLKPSIFQTSPVVCQITHIVYCESGRKCEKLKDKLSVTKYTRTNLQNDGKTMESMSRKCSDSDGSSGELTIMLQQSDVAGEENKIKMLIAKQQFEQYGRLTSTIKACSISCYSRGKKICWDGSNEFH